MAKIPRSKLQIFELSIPARCDHFACGREANWTIGRPIQPFMAADMNLCDEHMQELVANASKRFPSTAASEVEEITAQIESEAVDIVEALREATWKEPGWMEVPGIDDAIRIKESFYERLMDFVAPKDEEPLEEDDEGEEE